MGKDKIIDNRQDILLHYIGHRKRLKEKFLHSDTTTIQDYELIELLLFNSFPRKDVKPLAKTLVNNFGSIRKLLTTDIHKIMTIKGINLSFCINLKIIQTIIFRALKEDIIKQNILSSWGALLDYLKFAMGNLEIEQFRVLFLNKQNILISDEVVAEGTIDQTPVYPREIIKRALFHGAGAIILVHNHPGGNPKPSETDIDMTDTLIESCKMLNINIHDHVIIASNKYFSFKDNMLI
ncbi:RadC family protein [Rickettsia endosymbiont of Cardiosporidium cionae]|uniref:RadC family protein n=1 Tax=Rickettsia endosymbiont of Cardiosporidium cionae TaxID=2777155 RepID=UPI001893D08E|nr:DNA repair protein RadC [Rickettsia endosymbiont of Cardiosporidium cionae]KAF8818358.1 JAB domain-containing protein [Rickettsia endosymbiont of Cardiosporidium cionae]